MKILLGVAALLSGLFTNPVSAGVVDSLPDPTVIHARDGLWYAYGTQNPVFSSKGEAGERMLPILRSNSRSPTSTGTTTWRPGSTGIATPWSPTW
ncbi:hypothetical protein [Nonomuraea jabiensis]|uniref:hypothetical protein n=1 Tax=Nonomuraea jabiensis TaxID=882448 RepID=UPI0036A542BB